MIIRNVGFRRRLIIIYLGNLTNKNNKMIDRVENKWNINWFCFVFLYRVGWGWGRGWRWIGLWWRYIGWEGWKNIFHNTS
jgi:hypothetical protein